MRLLFLRATGLGSEAAEVGSVHEVDAAKAREFVASGRAIPAPGDEAPITLPDPDPEPEIEPEPEPEPVTPKRGRPRKEILP